MDKIKTTEVSEAGYKYRNGKILFRRKKEEIDSSSQNEYNNEEIQSSRKFRFQHQNFPGEKESGSEAHRLAIWWATKENVVAGDQTLISMNDKWYLVEKFDDADNGYQVEDLISQKEYKEICEEISLYGRSGKIESIQRSTYEIDKLNQQRDSVGRKKSSIDSDETQHGREDNSLQRVGKEESQTRETSSNGRRNSEGGGQDRQIKSSRKEDNISLAISTRAKALPESKVRGNYVFSIKWRGELTKEKITSYIKGASWHNNDKTSFARALKEYGSVDEAYDNIYYHGTAGYIHNSLKPSIILPKDSYRGGGYDQEYYAISVSKSKNRASTFTGSEASGNVYTILLRNGAKVIEMPEIQDSVELEDYIVDLWENGVDAVKLGDWQDEFLEQELAILNPSAIAVGESMWFRVYQKPRFENYSLEEVKSLYKKSLEALEKKDYNSRDLKFSRKIETDTEGVKLSEGQIKFFADTKCVDNEGRLLRVYHGTMSGDFTIFDISKANPESDMGAGFYFSSSYDDVGSNYEEGGQDLENKISRLACYYCSNCKGIRIRQG